MEFKSKKVLEKILQEAPVLSNLRRIIRVRNGDRIQERVIYAYYSDKGEPDPDLAYDRIKYPKRTNENSTLCEIYSFRDNDPECQKFKKQMVKSGRIDESTVIYQGPVIGNGLIHPAKKARAGEDYEFNYLIYSFARHFNKICKELLYGISLVQINKGKYAVKKNGFGTKREEIKLDLHKNDPSLKETLRLIEEAVKKLE